MKLIPLRDFFKNSERSNYRISQDGKYISYLAPYNNRMNIYVQKTNSPDSKRVTDVTDRDIADYIWGNKDIIIYIKDNGGDENYHFYSVNINTGNLKELTPFEGVRVNLVDELEEIDGEILVEMNRNDPQVFDVYRLNIITGELKLEVKNPGNISRWITDHKGNIKAAITTDGVNTSLLYRENNNDEFVVKLTTNFKETLSPLFFTFDNENIYALSNIGRDKNAVVKYDIKNSKEFEVLYENPDVDASNLVFSKKRKVLTAITYYTWKLERIFLDKEIENIFRRLEKELKGYEIIISDMDDEENKYIVRTFSDRTLGTYYLYDKQTDKLNKIADDSPWLNENEMAEVKPISYLSRDELTINGYLTLPLNKEHKNLPVVVNVHGGPWARDYWGFNPEVQFLANRGYAVLQMNFRGSIGFGRKFWEASFKQWGKTMQDDISDGVKWLIEQGIADPKRIAIYGGSYGGYAVLAGLAFSPELYAAGVDYVGVSNLFTFMKSIPAYWKPYLEIMYAMVGDPEKDKELMQAASPVFHVDKIKAPLFIAQGRKDPRVNVNESDQMVEALKKRGIDVPYMVKDNEGHGFHNEENKFDFYEAMEEFLKKHLKNYLN
ncbi:MAG: S9 family peptidase [Ignavibacteria bacterium]|nr:S9 family peptidase [Ignavibacteria bacterium]